MRPIYILLLNLLFVTSAFADTTQTSVTKTSGSGIFSADKLKASYFNYMNGPAFSEDEGKYSINHYLSLKHEFNSDWNLGVTFRPDQKVGSRDADAKTFTQGDSYLKLGIPTLYQNEGGGKVYAQLIYYAPISESSKGKKINGKIVPRIYATTSMEKFDFVYLLIPTIYLNRVKEDGQAQYSHGHWLQASYKIFDELSLDLAAYLGWSYSRNEKNEFNDLPIYPGFTYAFSKNASLSPYLEIISMKSESKTTMLGASLNYNLF
ncbi:MAG: hypothetical protein A2X86_12895 [Bdellovibrionales bacterium GWA2_49_15]|nr:MAG: hypothetical protein A2X86_12895 [Bdellovibrionales bacterium GWA2_49_15]HAZ13882.1 hypothetical protein [Bdellovibrionales bacterium]